MEEEFPEEEVEDNNKDNGIADGGARGPADALCPVGRMQPAGATHDGRNKTENHGFNEP